MDAARAASRAALVSDTFAPKRRPNCTMATTMTRSGSRTAANSTIAWPRSGARADPAGDAGIGAPRGSGLVMVKLKRGSLVRRNGMGSEAML